MKLEDARAFLFGEGLPCSRCKGKGTIPDPDFRSWGVEEARPRDVPCPDCQYGENQGALPGLILASREARALAALIQATGRLDPPPDISLPALHKAQALANEVLAADIDAPEIRDSARELLSLIGELRSHGYF